jgi:uncharacterized membrane protein
MTQQTQSRQDHADRKGAAGRMEVLISRLLRWGVLTSMALVLAGVAVLFASHPDWFSSKEALSALTDPQARFPHTLGQVARQSARLDGLAVVAAGLMVLIATPILRVAGSVVGFAVERDWVYVALTTFVLLALLASFVIGKAGG